MPLATSTDFTLVLNKSHVPTIGDEGLELVAGIKTPISKDVADYLSTQNLKGVTVEADPAPVKPFVKE